MSTIRGTLPTFAEIDHSIKCLNIAELNAKTVADAPADRVYRVTTIYGALRPLLVTFSFYPLISGYWRRVARMFVLALDALAADSATGEFKAGKDL
jgi:hypothetical protein